MSKTVADIRRQYSERSLDPADMSAHPIDQFQEWFDVAAEHSARELPNAMTLATADKSGQPSARIVLLKHVDRTGFIFYTNYNSCKGKQLAENPAAALVFWWPTLERQVRIQGHVEKISPDASDDYFASRPRGSQLGAWASAQSSVIAGREVLLERMKAVEDEYAGEEVPRPPHWGGYRVRPERLEFWQGQPDRLHDRVLYEKSGDEWKRRVLAP